jgi:hypothetical protein
VFLLGCQVRMLSELIGMRSRPPTRAGDRGRVIVGLLDAIGLVGRVGLGMGAERTATEVGGLGGIRALAQQLVGLGLGRSRLGLVAGGGTALVRKLVECCHGEAP